MKGASGKIIAEFPAGASCSVCSSAMVINQTSGLVYVINETAAGLVTVIQDDVFTSSLTVASTALEDGWILESNETSGSGKSMNSIATTLRLGDDAANKQYRSILSFDTSPLPDNAEIALVTLKFKYAGKTGTLPFGTHGNLLADVSNGTFSTDPNLQPGDFKAPG
jgi:hypothetical protein